jgi:23S rRNA pseudouridine2605 synthase
LEERLHKLLAQHGIGSRRQVEAWIREGRVLVNGKPAEIGQRVSLRDRVVVDGRDVSKRLAVRTELRVIVYHKPTGEMSRSREGDDRAGVEDRLPSLRAGRWLPVNSLAYGEDGLLILTNDGTLASAIRRNAETLPVEYRARALRPRDDEAWPDMPLEIDVEGEPVVFTAVERIEGEGTNVWFRVAADRPVRRGAVRALFDGVGLKLSRVMLVKWGPVSLPRDLPRGRSRDLDGSELDALLALAGRTPSRERDGKASRPKRGPKASRGPSLARPTGRRSGGR